MRRIVLFHPYLPESAKDRARSQLDTRWIGQGPLVDEFEQEFQKKISKEHKAVAVNSGTSALHLAYILAGIKDGDEVIGPVFTCSATYSGLLYQRAKPIFADIEKDTLNISPESVEAILKDRGEKIRAIVAVHYGGFPVNLQRIHEIAGKWGVPVIEDAAQAVGAVYKGNTIGSISQFTAFSFQAIKTITTTDGGMLTLADHTLEEKAKRLRWFGIDRKAKFEDRWKKDIYEVGYKYQMTDVEAAMGLEGLKYLTNIVENSSTLWMRYLIGLKGVPGIRMLAPKFEEGTHPSYWLCTVEVDRRDDLKRKLAEYGIESDPTHYRNDRYTVYGGYVDNCPNMDYMEDRYLILPMHQFVTGEDINYITDVIRKGW